MRNFTPLLTVLLCSISASAAAQQDERYAEYYGDGVRAYTESRYDVALTNLYRALALKPSPYVVKLIVRVHDFQGNCSARDASSKILSELVPGASVPPAQRCVNTGEVTIQCAPQVGEVRVDDEFVAKCGARLRLPSGPHRLANTKLGSVIDIDVRSGERVVADLMLRPNKWYRSKRRADLPQKWSYPRLVNDPDMPRTFRWKTPD